MIRLLLITTLAMSLLQGCSQKKTQEAQVAILFKALMSANFVGGGMVELTDESGNKEVVTLTSYPYQVPLAFGKWAIRFEGFERVNLGNPACGGVEGFNFSETNKKVTIVAEASSCAVEPFPSLINVTSKTWDNAQWDSGTWE